MRKRGIAGIKDRNKIKEKTAEKAQELQKADLEHVEKQFSLFKERLEHFAKNHRSEIRKNPDFRKQFQAMCAAIGVDPLSSSKGFWAEVLGMGDFYYELSVRVVEYCMAYRDATGGLIALSTIAKSLKAEPADIETALGKLRTLGKGYQVIGKGSTAIVQAVPGEFSDDAAKLVEYSSKHNGMVCQSSVERDLGWSSLRFCSLVETLAREGTVWADAPPAKEIQYWFPAVFSS